jgi:FHS family glucose/mannose:H+ symporter-like MFS transporter
LLLSNTVPRLSSHRLAVARPLAAVFFYFIVAGIVTVMLGPLLPALIQRWHIQDSQAGTLFTATFAGQLSGAWFAARNLRFSVILGAILSAIGCAFMASASFEAAHFALFCVGAGLGAGLTAGNIIVGTAAPSSRGRLLAMLNVAWGLGAIACPLLVRASASTGTFFLIAATSLAIAGIFAFTLPISLPATLPLQDSSTSSRLPLPRLYLLVFAAAAFLYIGIENALGGWLPSYALRTNPSIQASSITLSFWIAELTGRLLIAVLLSHLSETTLYRLCLALLLITQAALCATVHPSPRGIIAITSLSGLTLGPLYPLTLSFLFARTGNHPGLGPLFAVASIGGAILPWFTGIASTHFYSLRAGLAIPTLGVIALLLLSAVITRKPLAKA